MEINTSLHPIKTIWKRLHLKIPPTHSPGSTTLPLRVHYDSIWTHPDSHMMRPPCTILPRSTHKYTQFILSHPFHNKNTHIQVHYYLNQTLTHIHPGALHYPYHPPRSPHIHHIHPPITQPTIKTLYLHHIHTIQHRYNLTHTLQ